MIQRIFNGVVVVVIILGCLALPVYALAHGQAFLAGLLLVPCWTFAGLALFAVGDALDAWPGR